MKYLKIIVAVLFVLSIALFGFFECNKLINTDKSIPVIEGSKDVLKVKCSYSEDELLQGLKAHDEKDGDLTDQIIVGNISRFISDGKSRVTYVVFDSSNHPGKFTREVEFVDYYSPRFALSKPLVFRIGSNENAVDLVGAKDVFDGEISTGVTADSSDINMSEKGEYEIKATVTNSFGDTSNIILPVHVVDAADMSLRIELKENIIYLKKGQHFNPESYVDNVYMQNGSKIGLGGVKISSNVNIEKNGIYEVKYSLEREGAGRGVTWLTVVVE